MARAGAARLIIYDNARIKPGVLIRQPYEDLEVGFYKADALKLRLQRIRPDLVIEAHVADVRHAVLDRVDWHDNVDIVFDATASRAVLAKLEWTRKIHFQRVQLLLWYSDLERRRGWSLLQGQDTRVAHSMQADQLNFVSCETGEARRSLKNFSLNHRLVRFNQSQGARNPLLSARTPM